MKSNPNSSADVSRSRNRRLLYLSLLAIVLAGAAILLSRINQRTPGRKPVFTSDSLAVQSIELSDAEGSIVLTKSGSVWSVLKPLKWIAEKGKMEVFFADVILQMYDASPLEKGKEALKKYKLNESEVLKIKVKGAKGKLLKEAWFSDPGNTYDYFRYAGESKVYRIESKVSAYYQPRFDNWRSPYVLSLMQDQMQSINVRYTKNTYTLTRNGYTWRYKDAMEEFDVPAGNLTIGKLFNALASLGSYKFYTAEEKPSADSLGASVCKVDITQNDDSVVSIDFQPYGEQYLMSVSTHPDLSFVVLFDNVFRFSRHAAMFRSKEGYPE